jgi:aminomethyltransferase
LIVPASRTPLYETHLAAGARMVDFAGWQMPQQYRSVKEEHRAVRTGAGIFDVSHMGRFLVEGAGAADFLQHALTNDLDRIGQGRAQYTLMCRPDGGILDDLVVCRGDPWRLVVNASRREADLSWLRSLAPTALGISDVSQELGLLALQGPKAVEVLARAGCDAGALRYFGWQEEAWSGTRILLSRTGYTGEDGFELFVPNTLLVDIWEGLLEAGAVPCGLAARDVCRIEAGLRLYGSDMDVQSNPYQAGLGWTVSLDKGDFIGREALARVSAEGPVRTLVGVECSGRTIPRPGAALRRNGETVGKVTSGTFSFWLNRGIGMASVVSGADALGTHLTIETRDGQSAALVTSLPFYRGSAQR